jgi:hypothetical protein
LATLAPLADLALEALGELLRRAADRIGALARDPLVDLRRLEHADGLARDLVHDLLGRTGGREHALMYHDPPILAKVGDLMRIEVEKIGTLANPVVAATR